MDSEAFGGVRVGSLAKDSSETPDVEEMCVGELAMERNG